MLKTLLAAATVTLLAGAGPVRAGETLDAVRAAGVLACGLVADEDDYSEADTHGNLTALGADFCRAAAAEIFGDASKARFLTLPDEPAGLAALRDHKVAILFGATPHPVIGGVYGVQFGPPLFFDGQGFLTATDSGIDSLAGLSERTVCFINASPPEKILDDALEPRLAKPEIRHPYTERGEMEVALVDGHCDAITGDVSWMANARASFHAQVSRFKLLPETISIDPYAPAYRNGDPQWAALVDWTVWALLQAEEHGITQANVATLDGSPDPVVRRLTGAMPWLASVLGIDDAGFRHAIAAVGNYGELYERDVGSRSPLRLPRGRNALASQGGLMWALPVEPLE